MFRQQAVNSQDVQSNLASSARFNKPKNSDPQLELYKQDFLSYLKNRRSVRNAQRKGQTPDIKQLAKANNSKKPLKPKCLINGLFEAHENNGFNEFSDKQSLTQHISKSTALASDRLSSLQNFYGHDTMTQDSHQIDQSIHPLSIDSRTYVYSKNLKNDDLFQTQKDQALSLRSTEVSLKRPKSAATYSSNNRRIGNRSAQQQKITPRYLKDDNYQVLSQSSTAKQGRPVRASLFENGLMDIRPLSMQQSPIKDTVQPPKVKLQLKKLLADENLAKFRFDFHKIKRQPYVKSNGNVSLKSSVLRVEKRAGAFYEFGRPENRLAESMMVRDIIPQADTKLRDLPVSTMNNYQKTPFSSAQSAYRYKQMNNDTQKRTCDVDKEHFRIADHINKYEEVAVRNHKISMQFQKMNEWKLEQKKKAVN